MRKAARRSVGALRGVLFVGHSLALAQQVDLIVADGRVGVCAGDHWAFVMNTGGGAIPAESPPKQSLDGAPSGFQMIAMGRATRHPADFYNNAIPSSNVGYASRARSSLFIRALSATEEVIPAFTISRVKGAVVLKSHAMVSELTPAA
jgi:hypothetical protein